MVLGIVIGVAVHLPPQPKTFRLAFRPSGGSPKDTGVQDLWTFTTAPCGSDLSPTEHCVQVPGLPNFPSGVHSCYETGDSGPCGFDSFKGVGENPTDLPVVPSVGTFSGSQENL